MKYKNPTIVVISMMKYKNPTIVVISMIVGFFSILEKYGKILKSTKSVHLWYTSVPN